MFANIWCENKRQLKKVLNSLQKTFASESVELQALLKLVTLDGGGGFPKAPIWQYFGFKPNATSNREPDNTIN